MEASTVHAVLVRHGLNRLDHLDRATRDPIRRMEMTHPGELVHVDIKKLGRIPEGGGWRAHGRAADGIRSYQRRKAATGYALVHSPVDAYSRLAYSEVLANEQGSTAAGFWQRAHTFFDELGITVERVLTDNGACYRGQLFNAALGDITHTYTRPQRPQTNGKVERFNRTLLAEWAYARTWTQKVNEPALLPAGFTPTTITDTTPPSTAHPSPAPATSLGTTPRALGWSSVRG